MSIRAPLPALFSLALLLPLLFEARQASADGTVYSISGFATIGMKNFTGGARDYGGGGILEAHFLNGPLRVGPALGSYYVSEAGGGLVVTPLLAAASLELGQRRVLGNLRARGGVAPLTTGEGFGVAGLFTLGMTVEYRVDEIVAIGLGVDALFLIGHYGRADLAPLLTLSLRP